MDWTIYTYVARGCRLSDTPHLDGGERITMKPVALDELITLRNNPAFDERHLVPDLERAAHDPAAKAELAKLLFGGPSDPTSPS